MFGARRGARRWLGSLLVLALAALVVFGDLGGDQDGSSNQPEERGARSERAYVTRVVDGDTVEVLIGGREEDVRYIGVDTPETVKPGTPIQCFGRQASAFNHRLVEGRTVRIVFDSERRDVYGRLLGYVYLSGEFVNAELVRRGYARTLTIAPNDTFAPVFARLQSRAGREGLGLWGACPP
jgi:micrococcal nuclease